MSNARKGTVPVTETVTSEPPAQNSRGSQPRVIVVGDDVMLVDADLPDHRHSQVCCAHATASGACL
jgi:hypothetical protein